MTTVASAPTYRYYLADWHPDGAARPVPGTVIDLHGGHRVPTWRSTPRGIDLEGAGDVQLDEWISSPLTTGLYIVAPQLGGHLLSGELADGAWTEDWIVLDCLDPGLALGPQATEIYRAAQDLDFLYLDSPHPRYTSDDRDRLCELYEPRPGDPDHVDVADYGDAFDNAQAAAQRALDRVSDVDDTWRIGSCVHGHEYAALAARDLIGTVDGWTQAAYELLMTRYHRAFGDARETTSVPATSDIATGAI